MAGTRDARVDGCRNKTHGGSGTAAATNIGNTGIAGDGPRPRWSPPMRTITGIRDAAAVGCKSKTTGDSAMSMATSTGATAMDGNGTTGAGTERKGARTTIAHLATIEP